MNRKPTIASALRPLLLPFSGLYAADQDDTGMLAYVQSGSVADWIDKVRTRLEKERDACELVGDWEKARIIRDIEYCFCSAHSRKRIGRGLMVYHSFLPIN